MYKGQCVFGYDTADTQIVYLIEGNENQPLVSGNYVGSRGYNVHKDRLQNELQLLEEEGFTVIRTPSRENSMFTLARWAKRIATQQLKDQHQANNKSYTYAEFKEKVSQIPADTDFSRLAKYYAAERRRKKEAKAMMKENTNEGNDHSDDDDDASILPEVPVDTTTTAGTSNSTTTTTNSQIPADTDFSRLAKYYAAERRREKADKARKENTNEGIDHSDDDDDDASILPEVPVDTTTTAGTSNSTTSNNNNKRPKLNTTTTKKDGLENCSVGQLQTLCKSVGLACTGSGGKTELLARYRGPHPPKVWLQRKKTGEYVPRSYNVGSSALLVALYLHEERSNKQQQQQRGMTKEELYVLAESLSITKNPFSGGTTQTGPYHYDGWSNMKFLLHEDPALVIRIKNKRYRLNGVVTLPVTALPEPCTSGATRTTIVLVENE
eukprot:CAMPEP_0194227436 /NCGR_PEP_ID=MMETSP0156-20130528/42854_1 /TAXON_ID=33649 /ORGANISM="Thalassionema nitzschioides, Strain L26-B" /LENGTH=437 /DNA_ID=CAMNT_0038959917 /DNA_START=2287 /DNA_END=3602 /DNA_ORIENTATION=+